MQSKMTKGDVLAWIYIGTSVYLSDQAIKKRDELLRYLQEEPLNIERHQAFLMGLSRLKGLENADSKLVYDRILGILIDNPSSSEVTDLVFKTGKWYSQLQEPRKNYTLEDLSKVQVLLSKYSELEKLIPRLENDGDEGFSEASEWLKNFDLSLFEDNLIKEKLLKLNNTFSESFMKSLLKNIAETPQNNELQGLLKSTLKIVNRPEPSQYEDFIIASLGYVAKNPHDREFRDFLNFSLEKAPGIAGVDSLKIYNIVLDLFESSEAQKGLKVLVLDVGRWHFGRKNWLRRKPKPEDEQQMQNDILMRLRD